MMYEVSIKRTTEEYTTIEVEADDPQEAARIAKDEAEEDDYLKWEISESDTELHDITDERGDSLMYLIEDDNEEEED